MANFSFAYNLNGTNYPPTTRKLPVAASQTIVSGDALVMSSGQLAKAGDGSGTVVGVAAQDSDGAAAGTLIEVQLVQPSQVWRAVASADATSNVLDGTATYDLNAAQAVNIADTTGGSLQIIDIDASVNTDIYVQFTSCFFG